MVYVAMDTINEIEDAGGWRFKAIDPAGKVVYESDPFGDRSAFDDALEAYREEHNLPPPLEVDQR